MPPKILVITGPTGTGKTKLGVMLAKEYSGEIVSADSMQVYRRMDIGTAKVTPEEMCGVPHHMIDLSEPGESFSAAAYVTRAHECIDDILKRGRLPIVVGGTNLYIDSLIADVDFAANDSCGETRERLSAEYDAVGGEIMLERLREFDPDRAEKLHAADKKRIVRAIEVYELTGKTITEHDIESRKKPKRYDAAMIALDFEDRADLYSRIDSRVDEMVRAGLFDEVKGLLDSGLSENSTAMQAIGYKEPAAYFRGEISRDEAIDSIKQESRRYAKRQLTWLRRNKDIFWIHWRGSPDFNAARLLSTDFLRSRGYDVDIHTGL